MLLKYVGAFNVKHDGPDKMVLFYGINFKYIVMPLNKKSPSLMG